MTERAGNVLFVRPAGWQRKDNPDGSVVLLPPDLPPGRQCQLYIFSGDELRASLRERFDDAWRSLLNTLNARVVSGGEARMARGDGFDTITTTAVLRSARGASIYTTFFVAAPGTRVEAMVFLSDSEEQYEKHVAAMTTLVGAVRFANLQSAAPPVAVGPPAGPTAPGQRGLQVDSMYRSFQYRLVPGGRPGETRTSIEHLTFFTNGLVFRGWAEEGPGAVDPAADRDFFGTYKVVGDQVHIAWSYGRSVVFQRVADRLEERTPYARRDIYVLLPKVDGLRLQGTYVRRVDPSIITTPSWIAFARDGRFREQGLLALVLVNLRGEPLPPGGSGTYAIKDYTLELRYAGGYTKRIGFYIPGKPERPGQIFLNTYALDLQQ